MQVCIVISSCNLKHIRSRNNTPCEKNRKNKHILLDVLLCSIDEYFYELCRILASPSGKSKYKQGVKILSDITQ